MPKPLCLFHKNCLDGTASAAVVARKVPDCEFLAYQYGTTPPQVEGRVVYLVDLGLPLPQMRALKAQASAVHWIDHHASQQSIRDQLGWGVLDPSECGSTLCWRELFPGEPLPPVLAYVRDKDLWRWALPDSKAICAGLVATFGNERFQGLLDADLAAMADKGRPLLAKLAERVDAAVTGGVVLEQPFGRPGRALVVFANKDQSDIGDRICTPVADGGLGYDLAVMLFRKPDGRWVHSLRSATTGPDCGLIAAAGGGGGHPRSACFTAATPVITPPPA
jgi:hypothetical protein